LQNNQPIINIVVNTNGNVKNFKSFYTSLINQVYKNYYLICVYENDSTLSYLKNYQIDCIIKNNENLNEKLKSGYVIHLTENYTFFKTQSLNLIYNNIVKNIDKHLLFKIKTLDSTIPDNKNWKDKIITNISMSNFIINKSNYKTDINELLKDSIWCDGIVVNKC
jgi:hypothetical protein